MKPPYPKETFLTIRPCHLSMAFGVRPAAYLLAALLYLSESEHGDVMITITQDELEAAMVWEITGKTIQTVANPFLYLLGYIDVVIVPTGYTYILHMDTVMAALSLYRPRLAKQHKPARQEQLEQFLLAGMRTQECAVQMSGDVVRQALRRDTATNRIRFLIILQNALETIRNISESKEKIPLAKRNIPDAKENISFIRGRKPTGEAVSRLTEKLENLEKEKRDAQQSSSENSDTPPDGGLTPASPSPLPSSASPSAPSYSHNRLYAAQQGGTVSSPAGGVPPPTPAPSVIAGNPPQGNGNPGATGYRKLPTQGQEDGVESATRESRPPGQAAPGAASPSSAAAAGTKSGGQDGVSPPTPTTVRRYPKKRETPWPGPYLCDPDLLRGLIDADRGSELDAGVNFTEMELCRQWGTSHPEEHYHRIMAHIRQGTCKTHAWWKDKLDFWRAQKLLDVTGPILTELGLLKKPAPPPGASPPPDIAVPAHEAPAPARPRYDPYGDLPPAVAEALRQRDAERRLIGSGGVPPSGNGHAPPRRADSTSPPPEGERVVTLAVVAASSAGSSPHVGAGARGEARS